MSVDVGTAVGYLKLNTKEFSAGLKTAIANTKLFNRDFNKSVGSLHTLQGAMGGVGKTLTKNVTVPLVGMGVGVLHTTQKFQAGMSQVQAISGATGEDLIKLSNKAKEMGAKTKFSASESAEALKYMAMAGWDTQKMLDGLPGVMNLAAASGEDLGTVSDIVTDALTAFGLKAKDAGHFSDILAKASSKSNTNVGLMGETFKYVAPIAGALGYSAEDTAIAIGLMANAGIKGSRAGTALRGALTRLTKPTGEAAKIMKQYGISVTNSDGSMKSLGTVMDILREKMGGMTKAEQTQAATTIFGQEAMSGMLAIINASPEDYKKLTQEIYNADGAADTMAKTMQDNLQGQLVILKSTIEAIAISFGEIMTPAVGSLVKILQHFAEWLNNLSEGEKTLVLVLGAVLASIGPILLIGSHLIGLILKIHGLLGILGVSLSALTTPLLLVVGAVTAFALAWHTNFLGIRDITNQVLNSIQIVVSAFFTIIKDIFSIALAILSGDWGKAWSGIKDIFITIKDAIIELLKSWLNFIIDSIIQLGANLYVSAKTAFENIQKGFKEKWNAIKTWFTHAKNDPIGTIKSLGSSLYSAGKSAIQQLWNGFKAKWEDLKNWFIGVGDWIQDKLTFWNNSVKSANSSKKKTNKKIKGYATGLSYVPYDGFPAILHEGERVLTKRENQEYNSRHNSKNRGGDTFNFYSTVPDPYEYARQLKRVKEQMEDV